MLFVAPNHPDLSITAATAVLSFYFFAIFQSERFAWLFLTYPLVVYFLSQNFHYDFMLTGDGAKYEELYIQFMDNVRRGTPWLVLALLFEYYKYGFIPTMLIPDSIYPYNNIKPETYYLFQAYWHVGLVAILLFLALRWRAFKPSFLFIIFLYFVISPTYFTNNCVPTRHVFTSFSVFLLFLSTNALIQKYSIGRLLALLLALICVIISKAALMLTYIVFLLYVFRRRFTLKLVLGLAPLLIGMIIAVLYFYTLYIEKYSFFLFEQRNTFSNVNLGPLLWPYKLIMDIMSPFPWYKMAYFINDQPMIYGRNPFFFGLNLVSSLLGLYFLMRVSLKLRPIMRENPSLEYTLIYGICMSLSALGGSVGFHVYISIFFPFFAPLLIIKRHNISLLYPFWFVVILHVFLLFVNKENILDYF